jgi:hypothetical protein
METWALWYPKAASTGLLFARGRLDATRVLLVHAAPEYLTVEVSDDEGGSPLTVADLKRTAETPICRLTKDGGTIVREDIWPSEADINLPVILPGGEVGILKQWWHAVDHKEWRWQIELYNSLG